MAGVWSALTNVPNFYVSTMLPLTDGSVPNSPHFFASTVPQTDVCLL